MIKDEEIRVIPPTTLTQEDWVEIYYALGQTVEPTRKRRQPNFRQLRKILDCIVRLDVQGEHQ